MKTISSNKKGSTTMNLTRRWLKYNCATFTPT